MKHYRLPDERVIHVDSSTGIGWATYYRRTDGSLKRYRGPELPMRATRDEAQRDLDQWVARQNWVLNRKSRSVQQKRRIYCIETE